MHETSSLNTHKPPLHMLDIPSLLSTMKSSPDSWKKDSVPLSCASNININTDNNTDTHSSASAWNGQISSTLHRIDIRQRPLDHQHRHSDPSSNDSDTNNNTTSIMDANEDIDTVTDTTCNSDIHDNRLKAETDESDLIPGFYEGGLKVWECSIDLCNHLLHLHHTNHADLHLAMGQGGKIMELGCGHGLPACLLVKLLQNKIQNANGHVNGHVNSTDDPSNVDFTVVFTDYNGFVLRDVTLPNILLNCNPSFIPHLQDCCTLIAGDWHDLSKTLQNGGREHEHEREHGPLKSKHSNVIGVPEKYHMILSAETTYTLQSAEDTASLLLRHLEPLTGIGLVATKRYYFGVGGGSDAFTEACGKMVMDDDSNDNDNDNDNGGGNYQYGLDVELVQEYKDGVSNIRDLWRVQCVRK